MLLNCGVGEDSWESLGLQQIQPVHSKGDQSWMFIGRTDAVAETPVLWPPHAKSWLIWKRPWCWEGLGAGEGDDTGWDGWMASLSQWTLLFVESWSCWWRGRPGVLWFMGLQRVRHDWVTELNWIPNSQSFPTPLVADTVCSLCLWVCFYFVDRHLSFSFWLSSHSVVISSCILVVANGIISFFFYGRVVVHCIYVPYRLSSFNCCWTFRLLSCFGYCE